MRENQLKLRSPPIVEAVLDIECDMPPGRDVVSLEDVARSRFRDSYPKFQKQLAQHHQIEMKPGAAPTTFVREEVRALQFMQEDEKQLVQLRAQGFSFNRLAPYTSFDDYVPQIERAWKLFVEVASPVQISLIRLRYINRILLPMAGGPLNLEEFLKIGPRLPDEENLHLIGFFHQDSAIEINTKHRVDIVLTGQLPDGDQLPVILDNTVSGAERGDPRDWPSVLARILILRDLKNRVFKDALKDKCLSLLQQL